MSAQFDLEQHILKCWNITEDITDIATDLSEGHMDTAEAVQALQAYSQVYQRRFDRCFGQFEDFCGEVRDLRLNNSELAQMAQSPGPGASMGKKAKSKQHKKVDQ